jgi:hypothetical protein
MKRLIQVAVAAAAISLGAAAHASMFDISYTFSDNQTLTGSLDGTLNGTDITDISDIRLSLNGIAFAGGTDGAGNPTTLAIYGYDPASGAFGTAAPELSTTASQNNFLIQDIDPSLGATNYEFWFTNDPVAGRSVGAANFLQSDSFSGPGATQLALDPNSSGAYGTWKVTPSPVPLPATLPLLASGLGLMGFARRRRRAA